MRKLIIMRGLPGSGKSTKVRELEEQYQNYDVMVCSADHFMINANGEYKFDRRKLEKCHSACKKGVELYMYGDVEIIILDNTNCKRWEFEPYLELAREYGYEVEIQVVGNTTDVELYAARNVHGCPKEQIQRMADGWES